MGCFETAPKKKEAKNEMAINPNPSNDSKYLIKQGQQNKPEKAPKGENPNSPNERKTSTAFKSTIDSKQLKKPEESNKPKNAPKGGSDHKKDYHPQEENKKVSQTNAQKTKDQIRSFKPQMQPQLNNPQENSDSGSEEADDDDPEYEEKKTKKIVDILEASKEFNIFPKIVGKIPKYEESKKLRKGEDTNYLFNLKGDKPAIKDGEWLFKAELGQNKLRNRKYDTQDYISYDKVKFTGEWNLWMESQVIEEPPAIWAAKFDSSKRLESAIKIRIAPQNYEGLEIHHHDLFATKKGKCKKITCGGEIKINKGKITWMNTKSGHFKPYSRFCLHWLCDMSRYFSNVLADDFKLNLHNYDGNILEFTKEDILKIKGNPSFLLIAAGDDDDDGDDEDDND